MSTVIVFPRGELSELDKARMQEVGIIAIEASDPSKVVQLVPSSRLIKGDDILMAALAGANVYDGSREAFGKELIKRIRAVEEKKGNAA